MIILKFIFFNNIYIQIFWELADLRVLLVGKLRYKESAFKTTLLWVSFKTDDICLEVSIFLNSKNDEPNLFASPNFFTDSASPIALIIVLFLSSRACSTKNFILSASCSATCFFSIASENSFEKVISILKIQFNFLKYN